MEVLAQEVSAADAFLTGQERDQFREKAAPGQATQAECMALQELAGLSIYEMALVAVVALAHHQRDYRGPEMETTWGFPATDRCSGYIKLRNIHSPKPAGFISQGLS